MVSITRRPQSQRPTDMPIPPYKRINRGVEAFCWTDPSEKTSHTATNGPMALLNIKIKYRYFESIKSYIRRVFENNSVVPVQNILGVSITKYETFQMYYYTILY